MDVIWKCDLLPNLRRRFFRATVESMLMSCATTWTLNKNLESLSFDETYTRILRVILSILGKHIQLTHSSIDPSLIVLNPYLNAEFALRDTAVERNKISQVKYSSGHLGMEQDCSPSNYLH